jgi:hypothetical protein
MHGNTHRIARVLAFLDPLTEGFGALPPHFNCQTEHQMTLMTTALAFVFGSIAQPGCRECAPFWLASLIHHDAQFRTILPTTHPLWSSKYGQLTTGQVAELKRFVTTDAVMGDIEIRAHGLTPTTVLFGQVAGLNASLQRMNAKMGQVEEKIDTMISSIPEHDLSQYYTAGQVRAEQFASTVGRTIKQSLEEIQANLRSHSSHSHAPAPGGSLALAPAVQNLIDAQSYPTFKWPGTTRVFPYPFDAVVQNGLLSAAWQKWWSGVTLKGKPLRCVWVDREHNGVGIAAEIKAKTDGKSGP